MESYSPGFRLELATGQLCTPERATGPPRATAPPDLNRHKTTDLAGCSTGKCRYYVKKALVSTKNGCCNCLVLETGLSQVPPRSSKEFLLKELT